MTLRALVLVLMCGVGAGCSDEQALRDDCPGADGACPACQTDDDCVILSNACHANAYCTHVDRDPALAVTQEGCSSWAEYDVPAAEQCGCVQGVCRSR